MNRRGCCWSECKSVDVDGRPNQASVVVRNSGQITIYVGPIFAPRKFGHFEGRLHRRPQPGKGIISASPGGRPWV